ncbi:MAG: hypothetical protein ACFCUW_09640 [Kiloniellaceae bacterium]
MLISMKRFKVKQGQEKAFEGALPAEPYAGCVLQERVETLMAAFAAP